MKTLSMNLKKKMHTTEGERFLNFKEEIHDGEFILFVGHSGRGKRTLLRMLAGLVRPDHGSIMFGDEVWYNHETKYNIPSQKRNIAYMFQDFALFPNMTVEQNIAFAQKHKDLEAVASLINIFGLGNLEKIYPSKLSGGQKQRVALARALASKPSVLLLDEPLSSIDWQMRESLQNEILKAHSYLGGISIMVTHDREEAAKMGDRIITL